MTTSKLVTRNSKLRIRRATPDDIPAMMLLEQHSLTAAHWNPENYAALFREAGPRRVALVIETDADVQGFVVARAIGPEWEIENIAVAQPARRHGLGSRLLREFLDKARAEGATAVLLEVRESNRAARALYEKWAFLPDGRRYNYYRDPQEDAVLYRLALT